MRLAIDGPAKETLVFIPDEVKPLSLSDLAASGPMALDSKNPQGLELPQKEKSTGGLRISDAAANGIIAAGAAFMLGAEISRALSKKK